MERISILGFLLALLYLMVRGTIAYKDETHLTDCLESDREALIDLKSDLKYSKNRFSSWKGSNCCQWKGISCENSTRSVISVDLHNPYSPLYEFEKRSSMNLSGEISSSLLKLKSLKHLDLSFNTFESIPIPEFFGSLKNLQYLNISNAGFSGVIPPNLGNLSRLQYLDLSSQYGNGLSADNFEWMIGLISLKHLKMNQVDLSFVRSNWVDVLNKLPFLTELHLSDCRLSGSVSLASVVNFTMLSVISMRWNYLDSTILELLVNISSLTFIDLSYNSLNSIPLGLNQLPNLQYLNLYGNGNLTGNCSQQLREGWKKIEVLILASNNFHGSIPDSIGSFCNLKYLDLGHNNLTGSLPQFLEGMENCSCKSYLPYLTNLILPNNQLVGKLAEWLGLLENLVELDLSYNKFEGLIPASLGALSNLESLKLNNNSLQGPIPATLGSLQHLTDMWLGTNQLNGTLPDSFGQLSELLYLEVSFNSLTGILSAEHFSKLSKLKHLYMQSNSGFNLNVNSSWVPPFQIRDLAFGSCSLGPSFPARLQSQKELVSLDFSNTSISSPIPNWFWNLSSNLDFLNLSLNHLHGQLPNPLNVSQYALIDFSSNLFEGPIPLPTKTIESLYFSNNNFSGPIPPSIGESIASSRVLSLSGNQITGVIPASIGDIRGLDIIDLSWNSLTGSIPLTIINCSSLRVLDLGNNGSIPPTLGGLKAMAQEKNINQFVLYGSFQGRRYGGQYYEESLVVNMQGQRLEYTRTLSLVTSIDLSGNNLSGEFPEAITELFGLVALNLSRNHITGQIPESISRLKELLSLDLSSNKLFSTIPSSMASLSFLGSLNLSNNNFSGEIPFTGQMTTFDDFAFDGNPGLCGAPLVEKCQDKDSDKEHSTGTDENDNHFIDRWFYLSVGLGFAAGILVPYFVLVSRKSWCDAYWNIVDEIIDKTFWLRRRRRRAATYTRSHGRPQ
ncbi:hypothetical protein VitviT2T_014322 [Vitis vinifera]|uniref:Leucine-rich repeat-containing N-terminal plant-type domain-containing protein n=1 Tax=Vitis vinifera TaxID=29760 RepID=A0ABY9CM02_VITVI|nr:receptor-like protein EIX2 [Vitis vinifera]WJZ95559.1 hypothetical protein VitviT2T_014322 [Vitis vinifera]|eukprot:XP_019077905.1 PREDICTED: receptor-like protein 12 [Vitis vinifera]